MVGVVGSEGEESVGFTDVVVPTRGWVPPLTTAVAVVEAVDSPEVVLDASMGVANESLIAETSTELDSWVVFDRVRRIVVVVRVAVTGLVVDLVTSIFGGGDLMKTSEMVAGS